MFFKIAGFEFRYQLRQPIFWVAVILFGLTIAAAFAMHDFWHLANAASRDGEFEIFTRDVAICGGLLIMIGLGGGPFAIDNRTMGGGKGRR